MGIGSWVFIVICGLVIAWLCHLSCKMLTGKNTSRFDE